MKFSDTHVNREKRYSLGVEVESGRFYLSIPVSNRMVDYEEYYEVSKAMHDGYPGNEEQVSEFADQCRLKQWDHLLFFKPGSDRGVA